MQSVFVDRLYTETIGLLEDARDYAVQGESFDRDGLACVERCRLTVESMRTTSRLVSVMAWVLARRAEMAGEIEFGHNGPHWETLTVSDHHVAPIDDLDGNMPPRFHVIAARAHDLFARVHRLDQVRI
jgi:regulator of CtrA degradation